MVLGLDGVDDRHRALSRRVASSRPNRRSNLFAGGISRPYHVYLQYDSGSFFARRRRARRAVVAGWRCAGGSVDEYGRYNDDGSDLRSDTGVAENSLTHRPS